MRVRHIWLLVAGLVLGALAVALPASAQIAQSVAPGPLIMNGITYVPLQGFTSQVGASVVLGVGGGVTVIYNGQNFGLTVGSPLLSYGGQVVSLAGAPLNVNGIIYVPESFVLTYLQAPVVQQPPVILQGPPHVIAPTQPWTRYGNPPYRWNYPYPRGNYPYSPGRMGYPPAYGGNQPQVNIYGGGPQPHVNIYRPPNRGGRR